MLYLILFSGKIASPTYLPIGCVGSFGRENGDLTSLLTVKGIFIVTLKPSPQLQSSVVLHNSDIS
jgi:hypothetical protein